MEWFDHLSQQGRCHSSQRSASIIPSLHGRCGDDLGLIQLSTYFNLCSISICLFFFFYNLLIAVLFQWQSPVLSDSKLLISCSEFMDSSFFDNAQECFPRRSARTILYMAKSGNIMIIRGVDLDWSQTYKYDDVKQIEEKLILALGFQHPWLMTSLGLRPLGWKILDTFPESKILKSRFCLKKAATVQFLHWIYQR